ncbi:MAG: hypothetical protein KJ052_15925, partial [Candidatus Hydrogenedentes bacterium]|nr:hypothetical protein [Candidatus Hydrogenedentota bacterium]
LFGWYLTHEMNDLKRAGAYYNPLALYCKSLAPEKPVLVAPAGTPIVTHSLLASSAVDIFAYQDAVGAGYVPYKNTFQPNKRIATLDGIFAKYRALHKDTGKHLWADLEIWEMDGTHNYGGAYPAAFERVKRQIEIESRHAGMLTGYSYHGYLQAPNAGSEKPDAQARKLFEEYAAYLEEQKPFESRSNVLGQNAAQTSENLP